VSKPVIKTEEVGYFGSATVTNRVSVFVYSNLGPRAGNHVTVCLGAKCESARGHNARLAWYSASFTTRALRMGNSVSFTATASDRRAAAACTSPSRCCACTTRQHAPGSSRSRSWRPAPVALP
jgi:hypothetical protein